MLTVHGLHVLVKYVLAMAEFKSNSNLITNLDNLSLFEVLTASVSVDDRFSKGDKSLRRSKQHLHLSIQILATVVIHKEGQGVGLAIVF
jgi:hypothetical protein